MLFIPYLAKTVPSRSSGYLPASQHYIYASVQLSGLTPDQQGPLCSHEKPINRQANSINKATFSGALRGAGCLEANLSLPSII